MQFGFATATRILFGAGTVRQLGGIAASIGKCILVVYNLPEARTAPVFNDLTARGLRVVPFAINGEPTVTIVAEGVKLADHNGCDLVVGFGGGSAIDGAKAVAALTTNPGDIYNYLEVIAHGSVIFPAGLGKPLIRWV